MGRGSRHGANFARHPQRRVGCLAGARTGFRRRSRSLSRRPSTLWAFAWRTNLASHYWRSLVADVCKKVSSREVPDRSLNPLHQHGTRHNSFSHPLELSSRSYTFHPTLAGWGSLREERLGTRIPKNKEEKSLLCVSVVKGIYRVACAGTVFNPGRNHQISPPSTTNPIEISCVPVMIPPNTDPRPGSSRMNSRK